MNLELKIAAVQNPALHSERGQSWQPAVQSYFQL